MKCRRRSTLGHSFEGCRNNKRIHLFQPRGVFLIKILFDSRSRLYRATDMKKAVRNLCKIHGFFFFLKKGVKRCVPHSSVMSLCHLSSTATGSLWHISVVISAFEKRLKMFSVRPKMDRKTASASESPLGVVLDVCFSFSLLLPCPFVRWCRANNIAPKHKTRWWAKHKPARTDTTNLVWFQPKLWRASFFNLVNNWFLLLLLLLTTVFLLLFAGRWLSFCLCSVCTWWPGKCEPRSVLLWTTSSFYGTLAFMAENIKVKGEVWAQSQRWWFWCQAFMLVGLLYEQIFLQSLKIKAYK